MSLLSPFFSLSISAARSRSLTLSLIRTLCLYGTLTLWTHETAVGTRRLESSSLARVRGRSDARTPCRQRKGQISETLSVAYEGLTPPNFWGERDQIKP